MNHPGFKELLDEVTAALEAALPHAPDRRSALLAERDQLEQRCQGWKMSLGSPLLTDARRSEVEGWYNEAKQRVDDIDIEVKDLERHSELKQKLVEPEAVLAELERLHLLVLGHNASAMNVQLAFHIERISVSPDGRIRVRTSRLGALSDAQNLLAEHALANAPEPIENDSDSQGPRFRRLTKRDVAAVIEDDDVAADANEFAIDPNRFAGLGPEWFTEDVFELPERQSWARMHAREVAEWRLATHGTMAAAEAHFGVTIPTLRAALKIARDELELDAFGKRVSQPARRSWVERNAEAVATYFERPDATVKAAEAHFGKSQITLLKARKLHAARDANRPSPAADGGSDTPHEPS